MTHPHALRPLSVVVFAKDCLAVARFYAQVLRLAHEAQDDGYVLQGSDLVELAIVQAPPALRDAIHIGSPPVLREGTPLKASFAVADIEALRAAAHAAGGGLLPAEAAWHWNGTLHLDGWDPEGNRFQLRQAANR